jgi:hypothetical protein
VSDNSSQPAHLAGAAVIEKMALMCLEEEFRKGVGLPDGMSSFHEEAFFLGVLHGLHLARTLLVSMGDQSQFTPEEMRDLVGRIEDDHTG